jgi:hypothetical protein
MVPALPGWSDISFRAITLAKVSIRMAKGYIRNGLQSSPLPYRGKSQKELLEGSRNRGGGERSKRRDISKTRYGICEIRHESLSIRTHRYVDEGGCGTVLFVWCYVESGDNPSCFSEGCMERFLQGIMTEIVNNYWEMRPSDVCPA